MKAITTLLAAAMLLILTSTRCNSDSSCPEDIICSMVFVQIDLQVKDSAGAMVMLDKAEVSSPYFDKTLDALSKSPPEGPYLIVNDSHMALLSNSNSRAITFKGWKDGELVVNENFKIKHDCCHVVLEEGPEEVVISQ